MENFEDNNINDDYERDSSSLPKLRIGKKNYSSTTDLIKDLPLIEYKIKKARRKNMSNQKIKTNSSVTTDELSEINEVKRIMSETDCSKCLLTNICTYTTDVVPYNSKDKWCSYAKELYCKMNGITYTSYSNLNSDSKKYTYDKPDICPVCPDDDIFEKAHNMLGMESGEDFDRLVDIEEETVFDYTYDQCDKLFDEENGFNEMLPQEEPKHINGNSRIRKDKN